MCVYEDIELGSRPTTTDPSPEPIRLRLSMRRRTRVRTANVLIKPRLFRPDIYEYITAAETTWEWDLWTVHEPRGVIELDSAVASGRADTEEGAIADARRHAEVYADRVRSDPQAAKRETYRDLIID